MNVETVGKSLLIHMAIICFTYGIWSVYMYMYGIGYVLFYGIRHWLFNWYWNWLFNMHWHWTVYMYFVWNVDNLKRIKSTT